MIHSVVPRFLCLLFIAVIAHEQSAGNALVRPYNNLARFAVLDRVSVRVNKVNIIGGNSLAHCAGLRTGSVKVCNGKGGFGLTEALHDCEAGCLFELIEDLGVERLAGSCCIFD